MKVSIAYYTAIVANTTRALQRLLNLDKADSLLRGYRFSLTKCVIASSGLYRHHSYGSKLSMLQLFLLSWIHRPL